MLPTIPVIAQDILMLADNSATSLSRLVNIIETDPAISLRIISVSNSVFFGFRQPSASLAEAVSRIGFDYVKNIALGVSFMTLFRDVNKKDAPIYDKIYRHSMAVGLTSRVLLQRMKPWLTGLQSLRSDELIINGILHDVGYLIMNRFFSPQFNEVLELAHGGMPMLSAEERVFEFNHCDIGSWMAEEWSLPESVVLTARYHHAPSLLENGVSYAAVVHLADSLVDECNMKAVDNESSYVLDSACYDIFDIEEYKLKQLKSLIMEEEVLQDLF